MGVPAFYRWLVDKYPKVVVNAKEEITNDISLPNPNGLEYHNLYLDMNGIIHPCFHPHNSYDNLPTTFDQVFENMFAYIDRLVGIVRPRNLLYLAIDGVAPRAKMNQQRSRRFKTAKDNEYAEEEEKRLREEFEMKGKKLLPKLESQLFDSNIITPGTKFMQEVSKALTHYIRGKLKNDPGWSQLEVILSDATVPGEGEHKIMSYIRNKRSLPGYDPNTRHCLYGLDADLIMLALATHEVHFSILREDVLTVREVSVPETALLSDIQKTGEQSVGMLREDKQKPFSDIRDKAQVLNQSQRYQFLHIWILREYLELDMQIVDPPEKFVFDLERIIDDFVFICFFVGNDFLPHMPTLEIHEKAIDLLMHVYKKEIKSFGGYLVDMQRVKDPHNGYIKLKRIEKFILSVGTYEEQIFEKRAIIRDRKLRRILSQLSESEVEDPNEEDFAFVVGTAIQNNSTTDIEEMLQNTKELNEKLKSRICQKSDIFKDGIVGIDKVKLGTPGWKQRYYKFKFMVEDPKEVESIRKEIVQKYTQGLCWVLLYYYSDIPSWNWYYPYHYGPFASDLRGMASTKVEFQIGLPFKPFDQLMAVLPPKSAHALPKVYQELMTDCNSDIIDFYPTDFEVDVDGKRFLWQGICKLPFIQQEKLLNATRPLEDKVEECEGQRNIQTTDKMFIRVSSHRSERDFGEYILKHTEIEDGILCVNFDLPVACLTTPRLLEGIQPPKKIVSENDIMDTMLWHQERGRIPSSRYRTSSAYVGERNLNKTSTSEPAGQGRGFVTTGRGKGITPNNGADQRYHPIKCGDDKFTSMAIPQNVNRGIQNLRLSTTCASTQHERIQQNSFWSRNGHAPNENTSWRSVTHSRPSFSGQGRGEVSAQVRPHFIGQGRGRGRDQSLDENTSWRSVSHSRPSFRGQGSGEFSAQVRPQYMGQGRGSGRGQPLYENTSWRSVFHPRPSFSVQSSGEFSAEVRPHFMGRGRGRGRAQDGTQMKSQYPADFLDHRYRNHW